MTVMFLMLVMVVVIKPWPVREGIPWPASLALLLSDSCLQVGLVMSLISWIHYVSRFGYKVGVCVFRGCQEIRHEGERESREMRQGC